MELTENQARLYGESLERASSDPRFLDIFYEEFLETSQEIAEIFAGRDMNRLKKKLRMTLNVVSMAARGEEGSEMYLEYLGRLHNRLRIRRGLYDVWLDALISAVATCDTQFDPQLEDLWREVIVRGIRVLVGQYTDEPNLAASQMQD